ncbi:hypothetical protein [Rhodococcoides kyotonense]|uniref:Uncharacterized protein n=1 Tax=Rhodococcoides kyotonense TaxID=398843 RepID=A0A239FS16_9NOCA|nr:hypothetical protein [Rhodococcus kyotonensis]SNS59022.1 hypothetical protein SAMN05421642_103406 [Rhodococcus kyotonensis]
MNQDEIIEAEVEKAEQRYRDRRSAFATNRFFRSVDPLGVGPEINMAHLRMDLAEIAELYGFDSATGEYLAVEPWLTLAQQLSTWRVPVDLFDASSWRDLDIRIDDPRFT